MKRNFEFWEFTGFVTTSLAGTILHFLYNWLGKAKWIAPFSGINESTWEHIKLLFWPMFAYAIIQSFFFKDTKDFWCIKLRGTLLGLTLIPVIFYTYNGVIGKSPDWINIAIFFISAAISYVYEIKLFNKNTFKCKNPKLAILTLCFVAFIFVIFTFIQPNLEIFKDPISK